MPQPKHVMALPLPRKPKLDADTKAYFKLCREKLGFVPNVLTAYTLRPEKLKNFMATYNTLMLGDSKLSKRHRAMLDFAWKLTETPAKVDEADRRALIEAGIKGEEYFDLCDVIAFYNASNRMATGLDMMPNPEYHKADR